MSFLFPDTPQPPDPLRTAGAQTGTNVMTALANATLGNVNQTTPQGSASWSINNISNLTDPTTGLSYQIPSYTLSQSLTPIGQLAQDYGDITKANLALTGKQQSEFLNNQFNNPLNLNGLPAYGNANNLTFAPQAQNTFGDVGNPQFGFGAAGDIQSSFGAAPNVQSTFWDAQDQDFNVARQRSEDALMGRLNPSLAIERNKYEQQLADQGIRYGSPAYENAMRNYSMQANDARLAAIAQGGAEQQRMAQIAAQRGEFANKAQQQIYEQALGRGQFANEAQSQLFQELQARGQFTNAAQQQAYTQAMGRGTFANSALAQNFGQATGAFNAQNAVRNQALNEQFALRNQPINEISALLSGSQVSQPNFLPTNMPTIPTTDVAGIINNNFNQQMAATQQQSNNINNIIGGLFGLGGALGGSAIRRSDERVKHDAHKLGSVWGINREGEDKKLPIYSYKYDDDPSQQTHVGPMAQDVEKLDKSAVTSIGGVKHIILPKMGEILKAA